MKPTSPFSTMRDRLKAQTQQLHQAAENAINPDRWFGSRTLYCNYLRRLGTIHAGYEAEFAVVPLLDAGFDSTARRRLHLIHADLAALKSECCTERLPVNVSGLAEAIGSLYVIEGSTLGNRIVLKRASERLGISAINGGSFLAGYGTETGAKWREMVDALNQCSPVGAFADGIEVGAQATFRTFATVFRNAPGH